MPCTAIGVRARGLADRLYDRIPLSPFWWAGALVERLIDAALS
jgi:hypothetical protein